MAKEDPLEFILKGKKITDNIKTRRGDFVIAFPLPKDLRQIETHVAEMLDGQPVTSFSKETINNFRVYATLDVVVTQGPEWWREQGPAENCPDDDLIAELYRRYLRLYRETQKSLAKGRSDNTVGTIRPDDKAPVVGDGAFSRLTNG